MESCREDVDLCLDEMERQHGELHEILAALHARAGQARPTADLERLLLLFEEHIHGHFRSEEALMRRFAYDEEAYRGHSRDHREFLGSVRELTALLRSGEGEDGLDAAIERRLIDWLERHMKWDDAVARSLREAERGSGAGG